MVVTTAPALADPVSKPGFIRSFPNLPGFGDPTQQQIADLAQRMLDPNADAGDNRGTTSGFTYFGQFLDHDLTLDTSPPPTAPVDPTTLTNGRTFALDLDSVYGDGPGSAKSAALYDSAGRFRLQLPNRFGVDDYIRNPDGSAVINEARNDENQIIAQIQIQVMKSHNRLIDAGLKFGDARQTLVTAYQAMIVEDFLPHILSPSVDYKTVKEINPKKTGTPVEFAVSAYRFGHSQVRRAYVLNEPAGGTVQVFSFTAPDLRGGRDIAADREIDWSEFFADLPNIDTNNREINFGRKIDTLISSSLFLLPIPGAAATGSNVLAFRNMSRSVFYDMPSGQAVARELGLPVLSPATLNLGPGFENGTPLWFYVLAESERLEDGVTLGPTGSTIVAAGFKAALKNPKSFGKVNAAQVALIRGPDNLATVSDLVVFSGANTR